ncbi:MAG TPA: spermidine synthase, partial [Bacteroidales bacterium]|nr:spermidine synthase [Bacteroidales bacterium]
MEFWFTEFHTPSVKFSLKVDKHLYSSENELGKVDIFNSPEFGRVLAVDGYIIFTERDEFIYDEMLAHVPLAVHPNVEKVLVFGSGDGGVVSELLKYQSIHTIDL